MKDNIFLFLIILIAFPSLCQSPNNRSIKEINKIIESDNLIFFAGGKFTKGHCSVEGIDSVQSLEHNLYIQKTPSRESCNSFLLCDHEVTVKEYLNFILDVYGKENINEIPIGEIYSFVYEEKKISTSLIPSISFNRKQEKQYLAEDKYFKYPIIGISWIQANAYIHWLNSKLNAKINEIGLSPNLIEFVLPSSLQWEYAASIYKEDMEEKSKEIIREIKYYPFEGNKLTDDKGQYKANFGRIKTEFGVVLKLYPGDKFSTIEPTKSFGSHNDLYDMAGNVSEWTSTIVNGGQYNGVIVKGGSYKSEPIYMQNGVNQLYDKTHQSNEIGFRIGMRIDEDLIPSLDLK